MFINSTASSLLLGPFSPLVLVPHVSKYALVGRTRNFLLREKIVHESVQEYLLVPCIAVERPKFRRKILPIFLRAPHQRFCVGCQIEQPLEFVPLYPLNEAGIPRLRMTAEIEW